LLGADAALGSVVEHQDVEIVPMMCTERLQRKIAAIKSPGKSPGRSLTYALTASLLYK
jgi:hypothetical protein